MKMVLSCRRHHYLAGLTSFLVVVALVAGMVGCGGGGGDDSYTLTVSTTTGGVVAVNDVIIPGTALFTYDAGTVVSLNAAPDTGYHFVNWTGNVSTIADVDAALTNITMNGDYSITANFGLEIQDWYDLDAIRDNLDGYYVLVNNLDSNTAGYDELAGPTANGGKGWQPIGADSNSFTGCFDGHGCEVRDLFINRPHAWFVGLFGVVEAGGVIKNVGVVNTTVSGNNSIGGLVGHTKYCTVSNSYSTGSVTGYACVGGLVGYNYEGTVSNSYSASSVTGDDSVGGLVGINVGIVHNSYSTGDVSGNTVIGGLVGNNNGQSIVSNSYSTGNVTGDWLVGGLVGANFGTCTISSSYSTGIVIGNPWVGGLVGDNQGTVSDSYFTGSVSGSQYTGGLAGANSGNVGDSYSTGSVSGIRDVGGLVGVNFGNVTNSHYNYDGALINGENIITIGALFSADFAQWLTSDKFLDVNERLSQENGYYVIDDVGDFKELLAFGQDKLLKFRLENDLDLDSQPNFYIPYLAGEFDGNGHKISNLSFNFGSVSHVGLFGYLAPGGRVSEVGAVNASMTGNRYVGGLVGISQGTVSNSYASGSVSGGSGGTSVGGLVGHSWGTVNSSYSTGSVSGDYAVGGLLGWNEGSVSKSYSGANVIGNQHVGGLMGYSRGSVSNSYSTGSVTGSYSVGGLMGINQFGTVINSYSTGSVTGDSSVGGMVGLNENEGTVTNSFWDVETSGQSTSDGGTGKTTAEMQDITTFSGAGWDIVAVANPGTRNTSYIWNTVDDETSPFLSWQPLS